MQKIGQKKASTLEALLTYDDKARIILTIAANLHYSDIASLSLASKSMHRAIYPHSSRNDRIELLQIAACQGGIKSECWCCGREICNVSITITEKMTKVLMTPGRGVLYSGILWNQPQQPILNTANLTVPHATTKGPAVGTPRVVRS